MPETRITVNAEKKQEGSLPLLLFLNDVLYCYSSVTFV